MFKVSNKYIRETATPFNITSGKMTFKLRQIRYTEGTNSL